MDVINEKEQTSRWHFLNKKVNIFGKLIPVWALLLTATPVMAVATWILTSTAWIYITAYKTPSIDVITWTIDSAEIGVLYSKNYTITNPNNVPMLVSSRWSVWVDGLEVAKDKYSVDDLQQFAYARRMLITPIDKGYGCDDLYCSNLVVPPKGQVVYTLIYRLPPTYVVEGTTYYTENNNVAQIEWNPTTSVWVGDYFVGTFDFMNPFVPVWYP